VIFGRNEDEGRYIETCGFGGDGDRQLEEGVKVMCQRAVIMGS
jgi:hypothetical protein